jgi:catechol 2,3-dioxygenase-like lactoylglutathione lyase family enzyme
MSNDSTIRGQPITREGQSKTVPSVKIVGLHHAGIPCNNLERAVEFYTRVLGMKMIGINSGTLVVHFEGSNLPDGAREKLRNPEGEKDLQNFMDMYARVRPQMSRPKGRFARMLAGTDAVVLFERLEPAEVSDEETLTEYGIFHTSFHISPEDMDILVELKRSGNSEIRFHTGPVLRWPRGRAIYLWDTEGNYLELESNEDLPTKYGI